VSALASQVIALLQERIRRMGFTPAVHFELEGCYVPGAAPTDLDFEAINRELARFGIAGRLVREYWRHQWEYVSDFAGQTPLQEARNLAFVMAHLPRIMARQGVAEVLIRPVVWSGDQGKLAPGSKTLFAGEVRAVHIPNAIQLNVSVTDAEGENLVAEGAFGEYLQQCFLRTSLPCSLLFLPEEEAFERLRLKTLYGLDDELCSPVDISGGHQGSVALYRELGKHNQRMGEETLLYAHDHSALLTTQNWRKTARVEHRLGASSLRYDPFVNIIFALLNIVDALDAHVAGCCIPSSPAPRALPASLEDRGGVHGAISLFERDEWFASSIDRVAAEWNQHNNTAALAVDDGIGHQLKEQVLKCYRKDIMTTP